MIYHGVIITEIRFTSGLLSFNGLYRIIFWWAILTPNKTHKNNLQQLLALYSVLFLLRFFLRTHQREGGLHTLQGL